MGGTEIPELRKAAVYLSTFLKVSFFALWGLPILEFSDLLDSVSEVLKEIG